MAQTDTDKTTPPAKSDKPAAEKRWIWVINNEERHRVMPLRGAVGSVSGTLNPGPSISLVPGANVIEAKLWKRWKEENADTTVEGEAVTGSASLLLKGKIPRDPHQYRRSESAGQPYLVEGPTVASRESPLADLDETKAREIAQEILDEGWLRKLLSTERRSNVAEALRLRIEQFQRANAQPAA